MESNGAQGHQIISKISAWCETQPLKLGVLFGSQATGRQRPDSDVDVAIWPSQPPEAQTKLAWLRELETLLGKSVSLVLVSPDLDPVLGFEIIKNGRLIFEKSPELWAKHRAQLWHAYNDSLPFRRAARAQLEKFAQEVQGGT